MLTRHAERASIPPVSTFTSAKASRPGSTTGVVAIVSSTSSPSRTQRQIKSNAFRPENRAFQLTYLLRHWALYYWIRNAHFGALSGTGQECRLNRRLIPPWTFQTFCNRRSVKISLCALACSRRRRSSETEMSFPLMWFERSEQRDCAR